MNCNFPVEDLTIKLKRISKLIVLTCINTLYTLVQDTKSGIDISVLIVVWMPVGTSKELFMIVKTDDKVISMWKFGGNLFREDICIYPK